jgi:hypothetical protein
LKFKKHISLYTIIYKSIFKNRINSNFNKQSDKNDKQKPIQCTERELPDKKQEPALIVYRIKQRNNRPKTSLFQVDKSDSKRRGIKRILYKKRKKKM